MATLNKVATEILNEKNTKLLSENIKSGVKMFDVTGSYAGIDTSDATAYSSDILKDKTAYARGAKLTGTMTNYGAQTLKPSDNASTTTYNGYVQSVTIPSLDECLSEPIPTIHTKIQEYTNYPSTISITTKRGFRVMAFVVCKFIPTINSDGWQLLETSAIHTDNGNNVLKTIFIFTKIAESTTESISFISSDTNTSCIMMTFNSSYAPNIVYSYYSNGESKSSLYLPIELKTNDLVMSTSYDGYETYPQNITNTNIARAGSLRIHRITSDGLANTAYVRCSYSDFMSVIVIRFDQITPLDSDNIRSGITVGGVQGTYTSDGNARADEIVESRIAYVNGQRIVGSMTSYGDITIEANDVDQTLESGFINKAIIKKADITSLYDYKNCYDIASKILDNTYQITPHRQIDYIDFDKTQSLNLGFPLWNYPNWSIEFKVNFDMWYNYQHLLSIADSDTTHETWVDGSGAWLIRMASGNKQTIANLTTSVDYILRLEWSQGVCKCYVNSELKNTTNFGSFTSSNNLRFGRRDTAYFMGRLYYLKFWTSSTLAGDLIPAIRVQDDYPCMYDTVRQRYITNASGSTLFGYGPLTKEV